jgi:hypothetical protein
MLIEGAKIRKACFNSHYLCVRRGYFFRRIPRRLLGRRRGSRVSGFQVAARGRTMVRPLAATCAGQARAPLHPLTRAGDTRPCVSTALVAFIP